MNSVKTVVLRLIESLPEDCSLEQIQYTLMVRAKVLRGLQDIDAGAVVPREEAVLRMREWAESSGRGVLIA